MLRVIIAGGRNFHNTSWSFDKMDAILKNKFADGITIVSGCANGADKVGEAYAVSRELNLAKYPADWDKYGKSAGYKRNTQMAENADALIAFWDGQSKGTKHMIDIATAKGLQVRIVNYNIKG